MKAIDEILAELKAAATEYAARETNKEEFSLKIDLLIGRVERIEINFIDTHIHTYQLVFNQLLYQRKFNAIEVLKELQQTRQQVFNARVRRILAAKLFFNSIYRTVNTNMYSYQSKHGYKLKDKIQIFIEKENKDHE